MADRINVRSRRLTRDELATVFKTPRLIKAFEDLYEDMISTIPDAIESTDGTTEDATAAAFLAHGAAQAAQTAATRLEQLIGDLRALVLTARDESVRLQRIEKRLDDIETRILLQRPPTNDLQRQIDDLRTLILGS